MKDNIVRIVTRGAWCVCLLMLVGMLAPISVAQAQSTVGTQQRDAERQLKQLEDQRRAGTAANLQSPAADNISYADVLKDPDNVDLNFRFAKAQLARGDARGAVGTLERILLVTPDLPSVRMVYAIVLFRLDSLDEAEREFRDLSKAKLAPDVKAQIDKFLSEIVQRRQRTRYKVQLTLGGQYDTNRNSAPRDNRVEVGGVPFTVLGRSRKQDDFALLGVISGDVVQDLGLQAPHKMLFSATYFHDEQFSIDTQDTQVGSVSFGPQLRYGSLTVTPRINYTHLQLSREKLLASHGAEVLLERPKVLPWWNMDGYFKASYTSEDFHPTFENAGADSFDGNRYEATVGLTRHINAAHQLNFDLGWVRKTAFGNTDEYSGYKMGMRHTWLMDKGKFLVSSAEFNKNQYRVANLAIDPVAPQVRHERGVRFRVTYGVPVWSFVNESDFGGGVGAKVYDLLKDVTWTGSAELFDQSANIVNFDYLNIQAQTMLTKVWNF